MAKEWSSDVPISMPEPTQHTSEVPMFGFVFTRFGLWHDLNESEWEEVRRPTYAPQNLELPHYEG